ncbi:hypothetical protein K469DRAFT_638237 [Zopfia rhizophila CBS 207.26]|uniref:Uncharacterized protein n=1 Tax=Zopfia rhizophila CBS 207.26 TaxID=1314779 RepID=A0A6A6DR55_9PEZI|nr:hypothetical protein K469DRAFT_638237 [Zopfia rhizophila CBS 207.26]
MVQCGFNTLLPALVFKLRIFSLYPIGPTDLGTTVSNGNGIGTLTSVPGYNLTINATSIHMDDFNGIAKGGPYTVDARGLWKNYDGAMFGVQSSGLLANTPHVQDILANKTGVEPLKWGELSTMTTWTFTASGQYQDLADSTFVANFKMSPSDSEDTVSYVEYRLSKVLPGTLCDD